MSGNFYVIKHSGISHSAVESILQGLQQLSSLPTVSGKKPSSAAGSKSLGTGKSLLAQLRTVSFFLSVFRNSLSLHVRGGLLELLKSTQDSNNDVDRKIFRTALSLLLTDLEYTTHAAIVLNKHVPCDAAEDAFFDFLVKEVSQCSSVHSNPNSSSRVAISLKSIVATRALGGCLSLLQQRSQLDTSATGNSKQQIIANASAMLRGFLTFMNDSTLHASASQHQQLTSKQQQDLAHRRSQMLSLVTAACSALRRSNLQSIIVLDLSIYQTALQEALQAGQVTLARHILAVIVHTVAALENDESSTSSADVNTMLLQWTRWMRNVLQSPTTNVFVLQDGLASAYAVRICTILVLRLGGANSSVANGINNGRDTWPQEAVDLLVDCVNLSSKAPLKFLTELVSFLTSPALSWRILPALENKQAGIITTICATLTAYVRQVQLEDIYLPVLLRACESMGRFLQQRPGFDTQHSHRVFSAHMVEKDGESLKALWIALRRLYRKALAPKANAANIPMAIRALLLQRQQQLQQQQESNRGPSSSNSGPMNLPSTALSEYWAFDSRHVAQVAQALPSPYVFSCLIRTLIWLAPDQRYCRKEHAVLWQAFSSDLAACWDLLGSTGSSSGGGQPDSSSASEISIGDGAHLLGDLLAQLLSRVQSSMMVVESDRDSQSATGNDPFWTNVGANRTEDHNNGATDSGSFLCKLYCELPYVQALCVLARAIILCPQPQALTPVVIALLPRVYGFLHGFAACTRVLTNAQGVISILHEALVEIVEVANAGMSCGDPYRCQLLSSVREDALYHLLKTTELKLQVELSPLLEQHQQSKSSEKDQSAVEKASTKGAGMKEDDDVFASAFGVTVTNPFAVMIPAITSTSGDPSKTVSTKIVVPSTGDSLPAVLTLKDVTELLKHLDFDALVEYLHQEFAQHNDALALVSNESQDGHDDYGYDSCDDDSDQDNGNGGVVVVNGQSFVTARILLSLSVLVENFSSSNSASSTSFTSKSLGISGRAVVIDALLEKILNLLRQWTVTCRISSVKISTDNFRVSTMADEIVDILLHLLQVYPEYSDEYLALQEICTRLRQAEVNLLREEQTKQRQQQQQQQSQVHSNTFGSIDSLMIQDPRPNSVAYLRLPTGDTVDGVSGGYTRLMSRLDATLLLGVFCGGDFDAQSRQGFGARSVASNNSISKMRFEDIVSVHLSHHPSESVIETDFFDSAAAGMSNKRPPSLSASNILAMNHARNLQAVSSTGVTGQGENAFNDADSIFGGENTATAGAAASSTTATGFDDDFFAFAPVSITNLRANQSTSGNATSNHNLASTNQHSTSSAASSTDDGDEYDDRRSSRSSVDFSFNFPPPNIPTNGAGGVAGNASTAGNFARKNRINAENQRQAASSNNANITPNKPAATAASTSKDTGTPTSKKSFLFGLTPPPLFGSGSSTTALSSASKNSGPAVGGTSNGNSNLLDVFDAADTGFVTSTAVNGTNKPTVGKNVDMFGGVTPVLTPTAAGLSNNGNAGANSSNATAFPAKETKHPDMEFDWDATATSSSSHAAGDGFAATTTLADPFFGAPAAANISASFAASSTNSGFPEDDFLPSTSTTSDPFATSSAVTVAPTPSVRPATLTSSSSLRSSFGSTQSSGDLDILGAGFGGTIAAAPTATTTSATSITSTSSAAPSATSQRRSIGDGTSSVGNTSSVPVPRPSFLPPAAPGGSAALLSAPNETAKLTATKKAALMKGRQSMGGNSLPAVQAGAYSKSNTASKNNDLFDGLVFDSTSVVSKVPPARPVFDSETSATTASSVRRTSFGPSASTSGVVDPFATAPAFTSTTSSSDPFFVPSNPVMSAIPAHQDAFTPSTTADAFVPTVASSSFVPAPPLSNLSTPVAMPSAWAPAPVPSVGSPYYAPAAAPAPYPGFPGASPYGPGLGSGLGMPAPQPYGVPGAYGVNMPPVPAPYPLPQGAAVPGYAYPPPPPFATGPPPATTTSSTATANNISSTTFSNSNKPRNPFDDFQ